MVMPSSLTRMPGLAEINVPITNIPLKNITTIGNHVVCESPASSRATSPTVARAKIPADIPTARPAR